MDHAPAELAEMRIDTIDMPVEAKLLPPFRNSIDQQTQDRSISTYAPLSDCYASTNTIWTWCRHIRRPRLFQGGATRLQGSALSPKSSVFALSPKLRL